MLLGLFLEYRSRQVVYHRPPQQLDLVVVLCLLRLADCQLLKAVLEGVRLVNVEHQLAMEEEGSERAVPVDPP